MPYDYLIGILYLFAIVFSVLLSSMPYDYLIGILYLLAIVFSVLL
jgi:hypothetical protein